MVEKFFPGLDSEQIEPVRLGHIDSLPAREPELAECRVAGVSSLRACPLTHAHGSQQQPRAGTALPGSLRRMR
jgi:hypothetical protein